MAKSKIMRVDPDFDRFVDEISKEMGISKIALTRRMMENKRQGKKIRMLWDDEIRF